MHKLNSVKSCENKTEWGSVPFHEQTSAVGLVGGRIEGEKKPERLFADIKMTKFRGWNLYSEINSYSING